MALLHFVNRCTKTIHCTVVNCTFKGSEKERERYREEIDKEKETPEIICFNDKTY